MGIAIMRTEKIDFNSTEVKAFIESINNLEYGEPLSKKNRLLWNNYYEAGFYYLLNENLKKSLHFYEKAKDLIPENPLSYRYIGTIYQQQNELEKARDNLEKALSINPDYTMAKQVLINVYGNIVARQPERFTDMKRLVQLLLEAGEYDQAQVVIEYLLKKKPEDREAEQLLEKIKSSSQIPSIEK